MSSTGVETQWAEIVVLLSVASFVYVTLLALAFVCHVLGSPATIPDDLADLRNSLLSLRDTKFFQKIKEMNEGYSIDAAFLRIIPSLLICIAYVYNTSTQFINWWAHVIFAGFGIFTLSIIALQIPIDARPIRLVTQYEFAVEVLSCTSLIMARGTTWLNFSFLQAHIVLNRFLDVLPTLTALFWKKPQPQLQQKIRFVAIFIVHVYIFASGLQLFERLGDPLQIFRSTSLELTLWNALYFTFVTVFTVGYGDFIPYTFLGRNWMILVIMVGVLLVSYKIAKFHELSLAIWSGQGSYVKSDDIEHCVICGNIKWEYLKAFIQEFYSDLDNEKRELVVMCDDAAWSDQEWTKFFAPHSFFERQVSFYCGSCMSEEDLARAKVLSAQAVFVLNNQHNPNVYVEDSETLKRILTIRSYAPDVPIYSMCALTDSMFQIEYALEQANINGEDPGSNSSEHSLLVDYESDGMVVPFFDVPTGRKSEAICMQDLEMSMLAGNVYCNGLSTLLSNLLLFTKPQGKDIDKETPWMMEYKTGTENSLQFVKIPSQMHETMYQEIALTLYDHGVVLLATKTYFDDGWKPISPNTKLSHSSIGLVLTFLARIDLTKVLENIAEQIVAETSTPSDTDSFPLMDEMAHRTPSWHEIAGRRLTGDGPNSVTFLHDDYDELGEFDKLRNQEAEDADDELDDIADYDDGFLRTPHSSEDAHVMGTDRLPFYVSPPHSNVLRHDQAQVPFAFNDGGVTSANDNPEEFFKVDGESESGDDDVLFGGKDDFDIPDATVVSSREATPTDTPIKADNADSKGASSSHRRSALRNPHALDDGPPSKGSDGARVTFRKFSSIHEFRTRWSGDDKSATDSPSRRPRRTVLQKMMGGPAFPVRTPTHLSPRHSGSRDGTGTELRGSISIQELPHVIMDADEGLSSSLNLEHLPSFPAGFNATLGDFHAETVYNGFEDDAPDGSEAQEQKALYPFHDDNERDFAMTATHRSNRVATKFDGSGESASEQRQPGDGDALPTRELRFRRNREGEDGSSSIVFPGQPSVSVGEGSNRRLSFKSDSGRTEWNSVEMENEVQVCYGDMPLPEKYENHILVCVIGQMGTVNLKQFLLRLRAARRKEHHSNQQVVAICPVVTDENVQDLSELDSPKVCLVQGNSLSISTLRSAQYHRARTIIILACEDKGVVNDMDSKAIYTIMTLDHLIPENANVFVCSMIDSEESMHLLRAPNKVRTRFGDLGDPDVEPRSFPRRRSRLSMYGSLRVLPSLLSSRRFSFFDLSSRGNSFGSRSPRRPMYGRSGIRQSRSFVNAPLSRIAEGREEDRRSPRAFGNRSHSASRAGTTSLDYGDFMNRHTTYGGASLLRRVSTATLGQKAWLDGSASNIHATTAPRPDAGQPSILMKKSRDELFEKERYASGEMMISSMFIALLIREFAMPGLTEVVGKLFGTRLETQPSWVRSIPVPKSWIPTGPDSKGLEYRQLCQKLLEHSCIAVGLYRCGAAPVRVWYKLADEQSVSDHRPGSRSTLGLDDEDFGHMSLGRALGHSDLRHVAERVSALSRLQSPPPRANSADGIGVSVDEVRSTIPRDTFLGGVDGGQFHDELLPEELRSPTGAFSSDSAMEHVPLRLAGEELKTGTYRCATSERMVSYHEHPEALNVLPYVYTNPEPFTLVSEHDAVYVLVDPTLNLQNLK